jgi:hypothetical protein
VIWFTVQLMLSESSMFIVQEVAEPVKDFLLPVGEVLGQ